MLESYYAVIMAGGGGTRLWPLSRRSLPKQMLTLGKDRTLFQQAVDRLKGLFEYDHIFVVTVAGQAGELQKQVPELPVENYLIEPMPRGTASVVGYAAVAIQQRDPLGVMAVVTADHFIENVPEFQKLLEAAYGLAKTGSLVTLGIEPTFPATGYGYIQSGDPVEYLVKKPAFEVIRFREKPDERSARVMIATGDHYWNSGMFIWQVSDILQEFETHMPDLSRQLRVIRDAWSSPERFETIQQIWPTVKPETIDYGIMEKASRVVVLPARNLGWSDVGSWESLFEVLPEDENNNIVLGAQHFSMESDHTLVCSDNPQRLIVTIGVTDMIIVDTNDALLVCPRRDSQKIRQLVGILKEKGFDIYL